MAQVYGSYLDPYRRLKEPFGVKGIRQTVVIANNPSTIDQKENLTVNFPNLGTDDVIVPGSARLAFRIELESSTDANATIVENLGRAIASKISVKLEGREVLTLNEADIFLLYSDLWLTQTRRKDSAYQGIQSPDALKHRIDAGDKNDNKKYQAIATAYGNRFYIPLDFELLNTHLPFYQATLKDRLSYDLTFNEYGRVIISSDTTAAYKISNISLEFDIVTHRELAKLVYNQYQTKLPIFYERILHHSTLPKNMSDTIWNININKSARSLKGVLLIFEGQQDLYDRSSESFVNPNIKTVKCMIEGKPNQLYSNGLQPYQHFNEIRKFFGGGRNKHPTTDLVCKDLHLHDIRLDEYLTRKYALWLDLRTTEDNQLHGSGRAIENVSDGITIEINKVAGANKPVKVYVFVVIDAQLNIEETRLKDTVY